MIKEFKVYYGGEAATQEQLDAIEEIVVEQEIGRVWEARIRIPICVGEDGIWHSENDPVRHDFLRVRVEVRINNGGWVPLIDGRVVGKDEVRSPAPGQSSVTLVVHDDSALLHRKVDEKEPFAGKKDSEIARSIFGSAELGGKIDIDDTPAHPDTKAVINQHGTKMQVLRSIASRYKNYFAYVLPGENAGKSTCCFKKLPENPDPTLPKLTLLGDCRNLAEFNVHENANKASTIEGATLSFSDKSVATGSSSYRDATLIEATSATDAQETETRTRRLPPGHNSLTDPQTAAEGAAAMSSFTLTADGSVLPLCYTGILRPYLMVPVRLSDSRYSTNYIIFKVVHTLGLSEYTQSFTMRGNAVSAPKSAGAGLPAPFVAVAGAAAVSFNIQGNIF
jgi:hypothetical protein